MYMRRIKEEADKTRQAILDAALTIFSRQGYHPARLQDIAEAADVTRGGVFGARFKFVLKVAEGQFEDESGTDSGGVRIRVNTGVEAPEDDASAEETDETEEDDASAEETDGTEEVDLAHLSA